MVGLFLLWALSLPITARQRDCTKGRPGAVHGQLAGLGLWTMQHPEAGEIGKTARHMRHFFGFSWGGRAHVPSRLARHRPLCWLSGWTRRRAPAQQKPHSVGPSRPSRHGVVAARRWQSAGHSARFLGSRRPDVRNSVWSWLHRLLLSKRHTMLHHPVHKSRAVGKAYCQLTGGP